MRWLLTCSLLLAFTLHSNLSRACMVCIPFPEATIIDRLLDADTVVLARADPQNPFAYRAVATLHGDLADPAIDLFVNSAVRRRLGLNPDRAVVLARGAAQDNPEDKRWRSIGFASPAFESLVRDTLDNADQWRAAGGEQGRYAYFMHHLASEETMIRETAYLEVGRAPYDVIREADAYVPASKIQRFLDDPLYLEWRRLYILLLGVDASIEDAARIRNAMNSLARFDQTLNLSAWATALIEIDGDAGIDWLERVYLGNPARDTEAVQETLKALSVQGSSGDGRLRPRIAQSYAVLIDTHPQLAGWAARELAAWQDWRLAARLAELREEGGELDGPSAYAIDYYLGRARSQGQLP